MRAAVPLMLLLAACASPTAIIDKRSFECGPGRDVEIRAELVDPAATGETSGPVMFVIDIANNSRQDVHVASIRLEPRGHELDGTGTIVRYVDQWIPAGKAHLFEVHATGLWGQSREPAARLAERRLLFSARVSLANGDSYHCDFETRLR